MPAGHKTTVSVVLYNPLIYFCIIAEASVAVYKELVSIMKEIKEDVNSVKDDLNSVKGNLNSLNESLSNLSKEVRAFEDRQNFLTSKIKKLDSNSATASMKEDLSCIKNNLSSLDESMNRLSSHAEEHEDHMTAELRNLDKLQRKLVVELTSHLELIFPIHTCGGTGGWRRVVYLDMTDPNTNCPSGWQLTSHSKKTCGRVSTGSLTCDSVTFPVSGGDYTRVCGRIKGYQSGATDAFEAYHNGEVTTIDGAYVSGVSLTHGSPRQHIWTFAAGRSEDLSTRADVCPCDATTSIAVPPIVSGDYFCESGQNSGDKDGFFPNDPLWDGDGCTASSTCCSFNNPPYFTKQLPSPTTDDIEARLCLKDYNDDALIELIELYVQ